MTYCRESLARPSFKYDPLITDQDNILKGLMMKKYLIRLISERKKERDR